MRGNFQYHVAANLLGKTVRATGYEEASLQSTMNYIQLAPTPPVGLTLPGMNAPGTKQILNSQGFSEETVGPRKFYRGVIERGGLPQIVSLNPMMDTNVPYGVCNLTGLMTFF